MSKILSAHQLREADRQTIINHGISSDELMERAATAIFNRIKVLYKQQRHFTVFCGTGNNGGDGLVVARLLAQSRHDVQVHVVHFSPNSTLDFDTNLERIQFISNKINHHHSNCELDFHPETIIIDALLGTGVTRKLDGLLAHFAQLINQSKLPVVSIDLPTGIFDENNTDENRLVAVRATHTLSFQTIKYCFLLPEDQENIGSWEIIDIGLDESYIASMNCSRETIDQSMIHHILHQREAFSHKGSFGHALICAGSKNMMGAAVLSTKSCLRSGAGLVSVFVPACGYEIIQASVPEALVLCSTLESSLTKQLFTTSFDAIGAGPGIDTTEDSSLFIKSLFSQKTGPIILDADALNIIAKDAVLLNAVPVDSILTPHPKEFDRLFGEHTDTHARIETALRQARLRNIFIVLKGHHTVIVTPEGKTWFNLTGNAGMATGGSGDVLTGLLSGLRAQKYTAEETCIIGVFLHGMAGDLAVKTSSEEALIATDIIEHIGSTFQLLHQE